MIPASLSLALFNAIRKQEASVSDEALAASLVLILRQVDPDQKPQLVKSFQILLSQMLTFMHTLWTNSKVWLQKKEYAGFVLFCLIFSFYFILFCFVCFVFVLFLLFCFAFSCLVLFFFFFLLLYYIHYYFLLVEWLYFCVVGAMFWALSCARNRKFI